MKRVEVKASVDLGEALRAIEEYIDGCSGEEYSLYEASRLRRLADTMEKKIRDYLAAKGLYIDAEHQKEVEQSKCDESE